MEMVVSVVVVVVITVAVAVVVEVIPVVEAGVTQIGPPVVVVVHSLYLQ